MLCDFVDLVELLDEHLFGLLFGLGKIFDEVKFELSDLFRQLLSQLCQGLGGLKRLLVVWF